MIDPINISDIMEWLDGLEGVSIDDSSLYTLAREIFNFIHDTGLEWEDEPTEPPGPAGIEKIPLHLRRDNGYLCVETMEGENWIRIESIKGVRHVSHLDIELDTGDILSIDLQGTDLTRLISALNLEIGSRDE